MRDFHEAPSFSLSSPEGTPLGTKSRKTGHRRFAMLLSALSLGILFGGTGLWLTAKWLPAPPLLEGVPFSRTVSDRNGVLLRVTSAEDGQIRLFTRLEDVAPTLVEALLFYEDRHFYEHPGVNPLSLVRAAWSSTTGSRPIGASTITMQTARMRLGLETRTISGKLAQIFWALRYEAHYGKAQILEAYLNLLPWGGNLAGVSAASLVHFGVAPHLLTLSQSAALSIVPQNPVARRPGTKRFFSAHEQNVARMLATRTLTPLEKKALTTPIRLSKKGLPFRSPHAVDRALADSSHKGKKDLRLTVDTRLEDTLREAIHTHLSRLRPYGIRNASMLVLDARTGDVLVELGSADYFDDTIEGQVDGTRALRSPGSTLKPLVYGLALDQGLIHSETVLFDTPHRFAAYAPENADGRFEGPIGASRALVMSRNVPAVTLASRVSPDLYDLLQKAGVALPFSREHYGLSIVLGGAEVSPLDLAKLYGALYTDGRMLEPRLFQDESLGPSTPLFSREAAWIVRRMLVRERDRWTKAGRTIDFPYKTGTSNGFRDAWTVGWAGPYVVAVWLGAFDNTPNPHLLGEDVAAPLFKTVARRLATDPVYGRTFFPVSEKPEKVVSIDVCRATGDIPRGRCRDTVPAWFIPGISPVRDTGVLQEIWIDRRTGLRACRFVEGETTSEIREIWPERETLSFLAAGIVKTPPPPWMPGCRAQLTGREAPEILSPVEGVDLYTGTGSMPDRATVVLEGVAKNARPLFWFDGARPLGVTLQGKPLVVELTTGRHTLTATDPSGASASRTIRVRHARR